MPQISIENLKDLIQDIYALKQKIQTPSHATGQAKQIFLCHLHISYQETSNILVASGHDTYSAFVKDFYLIENPAACIKLGNSKKSILGSSTYQGYFIAILIKQWLKKKSKIKLSSHYRCNQAGIAEDISTGKWKFCWSIWISITRSR